MADTPADERNPDESELGDNADEGSVNEGAMGTEDGEAFVRDVTEKVSWKRRH